MIASAFLPSRCQADPALDGVADASVRSLEALLRSAEASGLATCAVQAATRICENSDRPALREAVLHPLYRHWRERLTVLARPGAGPEAGRWLGHLPRLLLASAVRSGMCLPPTPLPAPADGRLHLPGLPWHLGLYLGGHPDLLVSLSGESIEVETGDRMYTVRLDAPASTPEVVLHHLLGGMSTELSVCDPWISDILDMANSRRPTSIHPRRDLAPAMLDAATREVFDRSATLIAAAWPEVAAEAASHVRIVVPFASELMAGWSSVTTLGAIYIRTVARRPGLDLADQVRYTAERLVHEAAHTRLYVLAFGRPLFAPGGAIEQMISPLRRDPRPAIGVYHAAFVQARVAAFMHRAARLTGDDRYAQRGQQCGDDWAAAARTLRLGKLSEFGRDLLDQAERGIEQPALADIERAS